MPEEVRDAPAMSDNEEDSDEINTPNLNYGDFEDAKEKKLLEDSRVTI